MPIKKGLGKIHSLNLNDLLFPIQFGENFDIQMPLVPKLAQVVYFGPQLCSSIHGLIS